MADIVLVYPKIGFDIKGLTIDLPLPILGAATLAVEEFTVKIIDARIDAKWEDSLRKEVSKKPLLVGTTSFTGPQIGHALEATLASKETDPSVPVVWGGAHSSLLIEQTLDNENIDFVVHGEGERTLLNLARALSGKKDFVGIEGLAYKEEKSININPVPKIFQNLDELPGLPYHLVDIEDYIGPMSRFHDQEVKRALIFVSSKGCPYRCAYCCNPALSKRKYRAMSPERTMEHVDALVKKYHLDGIMFHDDEFFVDQKRGTEIAEMVGGRFKWYVQARMNTLLRLNLARMEECGLSDIQPGIESGSPRVLKVIQKDETVEQVVKVNQELAKTSIRPIYNFMMGFPTETLEDLYMSTDLAIRLVEDNQNATITQFYSFVPYPGTLLFDMAVKDGFKPPSRLEDWKDYNWQHLHNSWSEIDTELMKVVMRTSKFVDGRRVVHRLKSLYGPLFPLQAFYTFLAKHYRNKWKRHEFPHEMATMTDRMTLALYDFGRALQRQKGLLLGTER